MNNQGPLSDIARKWEIGKYLIVGRGEQLLNIRENNKALGDAVEAVFGAIFEDSDSDYKLIKKLIAQHWATIGLVKPSKHIVTATQPLREQDTLADIIFHGDPLQQRQKISALLARGVSKDDLNSAVTYSYQEIEILKLLCTQKIDKATLNHVLCVCICQSLVPQVKLLLDSGADANAVHECRDEDSIDNEICIGDPYTLSALQLAVSTYGDESIVMAAELIKHGANANWQEGTTQITHYQKRSMTIGEVLANPPKVEIKKNKTTALHIVVNGDNGNKEELISLLIKQGHADPNLKDTYGNTPLHDATYRFYVDTGIYDLLVSLGANQDVENNKHQTPRQLRQRSTTTSSVASAAWPKSPAANDVTYAELRAVQNNHQPTTAHLPPASEQPRL